MHLIKIHVRICFLTGARSKIVDSMCMPTAREFMRYMCVPNFIDAM